MCELQLSIAGIALGVGADFDEAFVVAERVAQTIIGKEAASFPPRQVGEFVRMELDLLRSAP